MRQPDVEIYVKEADRDAVTQWLTHALGPCTPWQPRGQTFKCSAGALAITWFPKAVGKWHSLYIEGEQIPWETDLACARSAHAALGMQIRCAPGGWQEQDSNENDRWLKIDKDGETEIIWKTD
ncbi:hypothetical protein [Pseudomonas matsuisoli]|uniref:Uncharacterized protein n=1 Tax=Pseudomonas matsuisoli TaxID=1515666 RepID=A0A917PKA4_9PSED|nr:hypothetical protein [Pseudomonas matsuisoli]GGJ82006.1 hypothetical protein GCM10009304_04970 [Pseudomonas matsuisoli]